MSVLCYVDISSDKFVLRETPAMKTLDAVAFLKKLVGSEITISLKNGTQVGGVVDRVDSNMNTTLTTVTMTIPRQDSCTYNVLLVRGAKIGNFEK